LDQWHNWLVDGGFEEGTTLVETTQIPGSDLATAERVPEAAHTGSWGYAIVAGPGERGIISLKAYTEKGDDIRFSFWARSLEGEIQIQPVVYGMGRMTGYRSEEFYIPETLFTIGSDWTEVSFETYQRDHEAVMLTIEVGPNTVLHIDDVEIQQHIWQMAHYPPGESRIVGGIPVPVEPVAPVHFSVLIHIEDPARLHESEEYYWQHTSMMSELARVLHEHGGFLTIQPEEDWPMASGTWHPGLLAELVQDYGVVYSTHAHGPHCRDTEGRLRSYADCRVNTEAPGWDHTISSHENPWVIEYVTALRDLLEEASGTSVTDHNGNWEFAELSTYAQVPIVTLSAYKDRRTQGTYDVLINNPWRPTQVNADERIHEFLTHAPDTSVVYIPGWGQNVARYLDRLSVRMPPITSQFINHADPGRVNTFYVVTHVGSFEPRDGEGTPTYITLNSETGQLTFSDAFLQDLQYWDDLLTELIDPLVAEGYLQWTSLPEMGELYLEWERNCSSP
jgi:hypothetical protein